MSGGVKQIEDNLLQGKATLDCPKEIDGGEGTVFDCTLKATSGDTQEKVQLKVAKENGELAVALADPKKFGAAVANVVSGGQAAPE